MEPLEYCRSRVAPPGSELHYALRFAWPAARDGLLAAHACFAEIMAVPMEVSDPAVGAVKLNWWREELDRAFAGQPRHPATRALSTAMEGHDLSFEPFRNMVEGSAMDLEYGSYPDFDGLSTYCHRTGGALAHLSVEICGYGNRGTVRFGHHLGMGLALFRLLRDVRAHAERGRCHIPENELAAAGLSADELLQRGTATATRKLLAEQARRVEAFFSEAEQALPAEDRRAQRFGLVRIALARALLREMAAEDYPLLERGLELTPIRKLWIAWRTARRNRRAG